ncbi:MAG: putative LPS assembly protein LptD [Bacteroidota bacterium]
MDSLVQEVALDSLAEVFQSDSLAEVFSTDSILFNADSIFQSNTPLDTGRLQTTVGPGQPAAQSDIETTVNYNAKDSIYFDLKSQTISMYGETHVDYGEISLEAEQTDVDWETQIIRSVFVVDSTGSKIGKPVFSDGKDIYETDDIVYNFKTKKARIKGVITEQNGAFMHGEQVRKNEKDELFITKARYTTCNLSHPHFYIESSKLKLIPGNKVVSGPFVLKFRSAENKSIFTPLALPFGMFPQPKTKVSGVIFPSYGEERRRGFFLRQGGYYWAISDYIDLRATADIYSRGGAGFEVASRYRKRYTYSGSFSYSFNRTITDDVEGGAKSNDMWIRWSHTPETRGPASFSASVSAGTSTFNQNNNLVNQDFERSINAQFTSNASYRTRFRWGSLSLGARQNQNIATGIQNITLPDMTLNVNRVNPFKKLTKNSNSVLAKLNLSHNFVARNELSNAPLSRPGFNVVNRDPKADSTLEFFSEFDEVLARGKIGGRHTIPISTSFTVLRKFTISPNFNYQELWYPRELRYEYDEELAGVRVDTVDTFSRAGSWRSGASMNTIVYGTYFVKGKRIEAIRHVITPSISFSYNPDFGDPSRGVFSEVQVDSLGNTRRLSKYEGFTFGSPPSGESQSVGLSLQNNLEMKIRDKEDSTEFKKVKIFDNLSLNTSYNFAADSFQLSDIRWQARTSILNRALSINLNGSFDPYIYELISESTSVNGDRTVVQRRVNSFAWDNGQGLGQLTTVGANLSLNLSPNSFKKRTEEEQEEDLQQNQRTPSIFEDPTVAPPFADDEEIEYIRNNPDEYIDFNLPWRLSANYSIRRTKRGFEDPRITQTLSFSGSLSLTPKTQVSFNSGYDIERREFTTTRVSINRDLHCWTLSFSVVPFGRFQSFNLSIRPRDSLLQELKIERRRNFLDSF